MSIVRLEIISYLNTLVGSCTTLSLFFCHLIHTYKMNAAFHILMHRSQTNANEDAAFIFLKELNEMFINSNISRNVIWEIKFKEIATDPLYRSTR